MRVFILLGKWAQETKALRGWNSFNVFLRIWIEVNSGEIGISKAMGRELFSLKSKWEVSGNMKFFHLKKIGRLFHKTILEGKITVGSISKSYCPTESYVDVVSVILERLVLVCTRNSFQLPRTDPILIQIPQTQKNIWQTTIRSRICKSSSQQLVAIWAPPAHLR